MSYFQQLHFAATNVENYEMTKCAIEQTKAATLSHMNNFASLY